MHPLNPPQTHSLMLLATVMVWLGSIFVPRPWNFILWGVALLIDLCASATGAVRVTHSSSDPRRHLQHGEEAPAQHVAYAPPLACPYATLTRRSPADMGERLGLFIIIDLGEMVLATVRGLGDHIETRTAILSILYGVAIAYSCWWLYFDEAGFSIGATVPSVCGC